MTFEEADAWAKELNKTGRHRLDWFYYAAYYDGENPKYRGKHFVLRRPKGTPIHVAISPDDTTTKGERA